MKRPVIIAGAVSLTALMLSGCGQSSSTSNDTAKTSQPTSPAAAPASAANPNTPATTPASATTTPAASATPTVAAPAASSVDNAIVSTPAPTHPSALSTAASSIQDALAGPVAQFGNTVAAETNKQAASLASELTAKVKALAQSATGNPELKTQVGGALKSLSAGQDASALGTLFQQAKQANLTPQQTQMVKDVGNVASAYVVQRNFSSLDGAQGDVATIVNSLRKGSITPAVPALQSLGQNASLTPQQKDLIGTLADQYAPGLKKASDSLKQGLQSLQGLTK